MKLLYLFKNICKSLFFLENLIVANKNIVGEL
jgi:hypothetical protein